MDSLTVASKPVAIVILASEVRRDLSRRNESFRTRRNYRKNEFRKRILFDGASFRRTKASP